MAVGKRTVKKMDMERFSLKKLNEGDVKEQHRVTVKDKFTALVNLEGKGDISRAWYATIESKNFDQREHKPHEP
jgi:hypothetical protein